MIVLDRAKKLATSREFRFLLVGGFNTLFGYSMYVLITLVWGSSVGAVGALLLAAIPSTILGYTLQRTVVWRSSNNIAHEALRFVIATAWQTGMNMLLLWLAADVLGLNRIVSQAVITVVMIIAIYIIHKLWTFRHRPQNQQKAR